jgi:pimeloyl-ACP methyl ester carboxylesterase
MQQLTVPLQRISVSYLDKSPSGNTPAVIFIHGFPFNKTIWKSQLDGLPDSFRGIAYDIRGFGKSTTDHHFLSIDLFARDLLDFINELSITAPVLCGISMGGYIALRAFELAPHKIKGIVLADTNCVADGNEGKLKRFASIDQIQGGDKSGFVDSFVKNVFSDDTMDRHPDVVDRLKAVIHSIDNRTICAAQLALASRTDTSQVLKDIKVPTLVIRGEQDKLMSAEQTRQLTNGIHEASYVEIPDAGHLPNLETPDAFNKALNNFLLKHF